MTVRMPWWNVELCYVLYNLNVIWAWRLFVMWAKKIKLVYWSSYLPSAIVIDVPPETPQVFNLGVRFIDGCFGNSAPRSVNKGQQLVAKSYSTWLGTYFRVPCQVFDSLAKIMHWAQVNRGRFCIGKKKNSAPIESESYVCFRLAMLIFSRTW